MKTPVKKPEDMPDIDHGDDLGFKLWFVWPDSRPKDPAAWRLEEIELDEVCLSGFIHWNFVTVWINIKTGDYRVDEDYIRTGQAIVIETTSGECFKITGI